MQNILYLLDCARYYKIRQMIVLILRPSEHAKTSTSKHYILRSTCLKFNLKTVLNSDNHGGSNSRTAALIITLAKSVLSPLAAPLCTVHWGRGVLYTHALPCPFLAAWFPLFAAQTRDAIERLQNFDLGLYLTIFLSKYDYKEYRRGLTNTFRRRY